MDTFLYVLLAGLLGTMSMSGIMWAISYIGDVNADMVRAIGSFYTKDMKTALVPGLITHLIIGILFAFPYAFIISLAPKVLIASIVTGGVLGFVHGYLVSFGIVALVSDRHPLPEFREAGFAIAAAHVLGHVFYGVTVGWTVGLEGLDFRVIFEIK